MGHRLGVLFDPRFWLRPYPIDHAWSDAVEMMLDAVEDGQAKIERIGRYDIMIGEVLIWVSNFPYAYGARDGTSTLPRRLTALRLAHAVAMSDFASSRRPMAARRRAHQ